jgi:hypothetical protein
MQHGILTSGRQAKTQAFLAPPGRMCGCHFQPRRRNLASRQAQVEESGRLMLGGVDGRLRQNRSRIGNQDLVDPPPAKVREAGFPAGAAQPSQQAARRAAVEIQAEGEVPRSDLAQRPTSGPSPGPAKTYSRLEYFIDILIAFQQRAKAGLHNHRKAQLWPPRFQKAKGRCQQHDIADRA